MSLGIIGILEHLGAKFKQPIKIHRAYVCEGHAKALFGNAKDYHHLGKAVDISIDNVPLSDVFKEVESLSEVTGIGFIPQENHIHLDLRDKEREVWLEERKEKQPLNQRQREQYNLL